MVGEAASIGCAFTWSVTSILLRSQSDKLDVLWLNTIRSAAGAVMVFGLAVALRPVEAFTTIPAISLVLLALSVGIGLAVGDTLYLRSLAQIGVARAVPLSNVYPLFTMFIAMTLLGERLTWLNVLGVLVLVSAVYFLAFPAGAPSSAAASLLDSRSAKGMLTCIAAALCWAIGTSIVKVALQDVDFLVANTLRLPMATLFVFLWASSSAGTESLRKAGRRSLGIVALTGFFGTGLGSTLFLVGVQFAGAAKAAPLSALSPLFAAPLSVLFLGERLNARIIMGTALSLAGVWLVM